MKAAAAEDSAINWRALAAAQAAAMPFAHLTVPEFVAPEKLDAVARDFPKVPAAGSFPAASLRCGEMFSDFLGELAGERLAQEMGEKLGADLRGKPAMVTVRGHCRESDGKIHTDSAGKLVTVLIYMSDLPEDGAAKTNGEGGKLRLLNSPSDINDYFAEITPKRGAMVAFACAQNAWHGHLPFSGERRAIQLNWVRDKNYMRREKRRHIISAAWKKMRAALRG